MRSNSENTKYFIPFSLLSLILIPLFLPVPQFTLFTQSVWYWWSLAWLLSPKQKFFSNAHAMQKKRSLEISTFWILSTLEEPQIHIFFLSQSTESYKTSSSIPLLTTVTNIRTHVHHKWNQRAFLCSRWRRAKTTTMKKRALLSSTMAKLIVDIVGVPDENRMGH